MNSIKHWVFNEALDSSSSHDEDEFYIVVAHMVTEMNYIFVVPSLDIAYWIGIDNHDTSDFIKIISPMILRMGQIILDAGLYLNII